MAKGIILVVEDDAVALQALAELLAPDYDILRAECGAAALELLGRARADLVLLDKMMPDMDGEEVCRRLKADEATADIPVIFITGCADREAEARGLELGAVDYVTKPFSPVIVRTKVRNHVALKHARDQLERIGSTDALTGLATRRRFDAGLHSELRRLCRTGAALSLIMVDIDHFKPFNDAYGHVAGDACLRRVGAVLAAAMQRSADVAARYGGEEFACILPETAQAGARVVADAIRNGIAAMGIPHAGSGAAPYVTASLGLVTAVCHPDLSPEILVSVADRHLYRAKDGGRNRVVAGLYTEETARRQRAPV
jgi:diguanylate cyclase (GGDEF)-like protein